MTSELPLRANLRCLVLALCALALACTRATAQDAAGWQRIEAPVTLSWPRDHGAHLDHETEWWYATGELVDDAGRELGFQLTIFRHGVDREPLAPDRSRLRARHVYAAHLAIVDVGARRLHHAERIRRGGADLAGASRDDLRAFVESWEIVRGEGDRVRLRAADRTSGIGLDLELVPTKPLVLHGAGGVSQKGPERGNASVYASWTRMTASGTVTLGAQSFEARGEAWFDHEWGTSQLGLGVVGWDWFGLRLDDGRELMLYRLRRADGSASAHSAATVVARDGSARTLDASAFELAADREPALWTSAASGAVYPTRFRLRIPSEGIDVVVRARVAACEVDGNRTTGTVYWEGPVVVEGTVAGSGYGELTGYAGSLERRF